MPNFLSSSSSSNKAQQWLNKLTPLPRSSLSDSALPSRRVILCPTNSNNSTSSVVTSSLVRPSRFVKPNSSSNSIDSNGVATGMDSFVNIYKVYSQKVYMEGYLMHQDKKYFVDLCGTTLALWDTEQPGEAVTPECIPIMMDFKVYSTLRQQFTLNLSHKKKNMVFDTLDPASLTKWICALHLARFERQLLDQYFTLHLFLQSDTTQSANNCSGYMQVLLPNNKNEWKKLWVVVTNGNNNSGTISKKSKFLHKQDPASSSLQFTPSCPQFILLESKKSKTPLLTLKLIHHAYAVYPDSASMICQSTLMRLEGIQQDDKPMDILLMADSSNHMTRWLSSLYNAFKLYGRPQSLVQDTMDPMALNFGDNWSLDTEDIAQFMDAFASMDNFGIHQLLVNALQQKQSLSKTTSTNYSQARANSLPLITVESMDPPRQRSTSDAGILNVPLTRSNLHSQIVDSSDESDVSSDGDVDDFDADSDDEPICKSKQIASRRSSTSSRNMLSSFLIPDFDFGNGFDADRRGSATNSVMLSREPSPTSSRQRSTNQQSQHSSSGSSTTSSSGISDTMNKGSAPTPSSLFGDFSFTTDFSKYLDPSPDRKYSLPPNVKLYHTPKGGSKSNELDRPSWNEYGWDNRSPRNSYLDEDYIYDQDGPLIPSLNDHFAPRNSLLDTHAGEQLSAKEQIEYAKATGQPLIQVPVKPKPPKGGLVGVISQREMNRRQGKGTRVTERVNQHHANRLEREKERRISEQRQQQYMKHQIMMYATNRYVHPLMIPPVLSPTSPRPYSPSGHSYQGLPPSFANRCEGRLY